MIQLRRALLIVLAFVAMALVVAQLGWTPWAEGVRARNERYQREHPRPVVIARRVGADNRPPRGSLVRHYVVSFAGPLLLVGATGGLTLLVLRREGRRGRRTGRLRNQTAA